MDIKNVVFVNYWIKLSMTTTIMQIEEGYDPDWIGWFFSYISQIW